MKNLMIFLLFWAMAALARPYTPLSDIDFQNHPTRSVVVDSYQIKYSYHTQNNYNPEIYHQNIVPISEQIFAYAADHNLPLQECKQSVNMDIFEVDTDILNDTSRITGWQQHSPDAQVIWALYDPLSEYPRWSVIVVTDHGERNNQILFAHELAHYWFSRFCWSDQWPEGTEHFARSFQSFYVQNL